MSTLRLLPCLAFVAMRFEDEGGQAVWEAETDVSSDQRQGLGLGHELSLAHQPSIIKTTGSSGGGGGGGGGGSGSSGGGGVRRFTFDPSLCSFTATLPCLRKVS